MGYQEAIKKLDQIQALKNDGRGISCVRAILFHLQRGEGRAAQTVFLTESDKIRSYPDVEKLVKYIFVKFDYCIVGKRCTQLS
jgi:hypothetical protein